MSRHENVRRYFQGGQATNGKRHEADHSQFEVIRPAKPDLSHDFYHGGRVEFCPKSSFQISDEISEDRLVHGFTPVLQKRATTFDVSDEFMSGIHGYYAFRPTEAACTRCTIADAVQ